MRNPNEPPPSPESPDPAEVEKAKTAVIEKARAWRAACKLPSVSARKQFNPEQEARFTTEGEEHLLLEAAGLALQQALEELQQLVGADKMLEVMDDLRQLVAES